MPRFIRDDDFATVMRGIGKRIQDARRLVEPNSAAFCRLLGCDKSTLAKIETGERAPSIFLIMAIAHKLRLTPDYLLNGNVRGVDPEMAFRLGQMQRERTSTETAPDTHRTPSSPSRRKKAA